MTLNVPVSLFVSMLSTSVDFIHKKCVFGEMKSVCRSVEFSGKLDRLLILTSFGQNSPYVRKNIVRNIRVEKRCSLSKIFKVPYLCGTIEMQF